MNLQLSLIVIGVVLLAIVYLITRASRRKASSSTGEDKGGDDDRRISGDHDDLGLGPVFKEERLGSRANPPVDSSEKSSDDLPPPDRVERADDGHSEYLDTAVTHEEGGQRDSGRIVGSTGHSSTNDADRLGIEPQTVGPVDDSVDQGPKIPVLAVEVMPGDYPSEPDNPVAGKDREGFLMGANTSREESNGKTDIASPYNGRNGGSQEKSVRPDPDESGGMDHSMDEETFESGEKEDLPEDDPVFPYRGMLDQPYQRVNNLDEEGRVEPTLDVEKDYQEVQTEHRESVMGDSAGFSYPEIDGFARITQIDYWAKIFGNKDVGRETVIAQYHAGISSLSDKCRIFGLKVPDQKWFDMEQQSEGARFNDIVVSIQLAGPNGPVSALELDKFVRVVKKISMGTGRQYSIMADKDSALKQAQAIAEFIRCYDSVHLVNVQSSQKNYMHGRDIERAAAQLGLEKGANNFFVRYKTAGKEKVNLYCLVNMNETGEFDFGNLSQLSTEGVIFFFRPAINRLPGAVFSEMVYTAKSFASRVQAEVLSKNKQDLSQDDIDRIRRSIEDRANEMKVLGLASGSEEAMRIFRSY